MLFGDQLERRSILTRGSPARALGPFCRSLIAVAALGCTELEPGYETAESVSNSPDPSSMLPGDGDWGCLGNRVVEPTINEYGPGKVQYLLPIVDSVTRGPPTDLKVSACSATDVNCTEPFVSDVGPGPDGMVSVTVPQNFDGFFTMQARGTVPSMLFIDGRLEENTQAAPLFLIAIQPLIDLAVANNATIDMERGVLVVRTYDCANQLAAGVEISNDRGGQVYAFVDELPNIGVGVTDEQGTAGFINVPPGVAVVRGRLASTGRETARNSVRVRAGWFSYADLRANP